MREHLSKLKSERARIAGLPITKAAALARLDDLVGHLANNRRSGREALVAALMAPGKTISPDGFLPAPTLPEHNIRLGWLLANGVRELLGPAVEAAYATNETGIDDAERARQLAKIDDHIFDCELAEEAALRAAQEAGIAIPRRPDADPRAVLARDTDLPS